MSSMSSRERLRSALGLVETLPDATPWVPLIDPANTPCIVPPDIRAKSDQLATARCIHEALGCDILVRDRVFRVRHRTATDTTETRDDTITRTVTIGGRRLVWVDRVVFHGLQESRARVKFPIETVDDLLTYRLLVEDSYVEVDGEELARLSEGVEDSGIATPEIPRTSAMELIIELMGFERFTYALFDYPDLMAEVLSTMDVLFFEILRKTLETPVPFEIVQNYDDFDVLLTSPRQFDELVVPRLARTAAMCRKSGKKLMVHACGHLREFMSSMSTVGYDAHHYLSSKPVGNLDFEEAMGALPESMTLMPALNPLLLEDGTSEQVFAHAQAVASQFEPRGRFVVMTSNKPQIPKENLLAIKRAYR